MSRGTPARFALATPTTWTDPWPMYGALRDHDPVHHVVPPDKPDHDYYVLSRHADVFVAARDNQTFSTAQGLTVNYGELEMIGLADNPPMVMQDPPVHTDFRKLVSRGFTPRQVERQYGSGAGELDVTRKPRNILTFGYGAHHCLGAGAARMQ